jgi:U3 small nucleolar ribonucleoprotein protein LCP5
MAEVSLTVFVKDYLEKAHKIQTILLRLVEHAKLNADKVDGNQGMNFLQAKCRLLADYCVCLAYYVRRRLRGEPIIILQTSENGSADDHAEVTYHPVIHRLMKGRVYLEKMKPLEVKLKPQIDRILNAALLADEEANAALLHKPNLDALERPSLEKRSIGAFDKEDSGDDQLRDVYRAPKVAPMYYEDGKSSKEVKRDEREKKAFENSLLMRQLMEEYSELPEEVDDTTLEPVILRRDSRKSKGKSRSGGDAVDAYEEAHFSRINLPKKEAKMREAAQKSKKIRSMADELEEMFNVKYRDPFAKTSGRDSNKESLTRKTRRGKRDSDDDDEIASDDDFE